MEGNNVVALARQAAAAARSERAAQEAAMRPVRKYRGVQRRRNRYRATIWNPDTRRQLWLGSYDTPEEAAYAYDAAARSIQDHCAKPNFPVPSSTPPPPLTNLAQALRALQVPLPARNNNQLPTAGPQQAPPLLPWATQLHQRVVAAGNFLNHGAPPALQGGFVRLHGSAAGASAPNGTGLYRPFPSIPGGYVPVTLEELRLNWPTSSEQSSTEPGSSAATAVPRRRRLATTSTAMGFEDGSIVGDNFSSDGASSSSVASTSGRWW